jgi:hypothetical protein
MATGKTHARWFRLIVDGIDLSGDARQIGQFGVNRQMANIEGWNSGVQHYTLGHAEHILNGFQEVFNNTAATGSHTELSAVEEYIVSLCMGIRAAPAVGDPAFLSSFEQMNYTVDGTEAVLVNAEFVKSITDSDHEAAFGNVIAAGAALAATTNGTSIDNAASSANGAMAHLHVTVSDGGTWAFKVQDSPDDAAWSDLITFTADGTAVAAERGDATGTVDRHLRFQATRTSGTCTAWCTVVRQ